MARPEPSLNSTPRQSGEERRVAIIQAATEEFAQRGYAGGSTETIARRVGISQPYIFRLFGTKRDLFLATFSAVCMHMRQVCVTAAQSTDGDPLQAMGQAYAQMHSGRHDLLMLFQAISASGEEEIRTEVRQQYWALFEEIRALAGVTHAQMQSFFADGLLLTVSAILELPELMSAEKP